MSTYVVAYLSLFDGELQQRIIAADTKLEAYKKFLANREGKEDASWFYEYDSVKLLEEDIFNMDSFISAIQVF